MAEDVKVLKVVVDGIDQYLADVKSIEKYTKLIEEELSKTGKSLPTSEIKKFANSLASAEKEANDLAKSVKNLGEETEKTDKKSSKLGGNIKSSKGAFKELGREISNSIGLFGGIGDAIVGSFLGGGVANLVESLTSKLLEFAFAEDEVAKATKEVVDSFSEERVELAANGQALLDTNASLEDRQRALDNLIKTNPDYFDGLKLETTNYQELKNAVDAANDAILGKVSRQLKVNKSLVEEKSLQEQILIVEELQLEKARLLQQGLNAYTSKELPINQKRIELAEKELAIRQNIYLQSIANINKLSAAEQQAQDEIDKRRRRADGGNATNDQLKALEDSAKAKADLSKKSQDAAEAARKAALEAEKKSNKELLDLLQNEVNKRVELSSKGSLAEREAQDLIIEAIQRVALERTKSGDLVSELSKKTTEELKKEIAVNEGLILNFFNKINEIKPFTGIDKFKNELDTLKPLLESGEITISDFFIALQKKGINFSDVEIKKSFGVLFKDLLNGFEDSKNIISQNTIELQKLEEQTKKTGINSSQIFDIVGKGAEKSAEIELQNLKKLQEGIAKELAENPVVFQALLNSIESTDLELLAKAEKAVIISSFQKGLDDLIDPVKKLWEDFKKESGFTGDVSFDGIIEGFDKVEVSPKYEATLKSLIRNSEDANTEIKLSAEKKNIDLARIDEVSVQTLLKNLESRNRIQKETDLENLRNRTFSEEKTAEETLKKHLNLQEDLKKANKTFSKEQLVQIEKDSKSIIAELDSRTKEEVRIMTEDFLKVLFDAIAKTDSQAALKAVNKFTNDSNDILEKGVKKAEAITKDFEPLLEIPESSVEDFKKKVQEFINKVTPVIQFATDIMNRIFTIAETLQQRTIDNITKQITEVDSQLSDTASRVDALENDLADKRSGRREAVLRGIELEKEREQDLLDKKIELQRKLAEEEKKQNNIRKAQAISNAVISGALAVMQGFAQFGPIGGAIAAVVIAAITAVEIGLIASQKFAKGGFTSNNPSNLGERDETGFRVAGVVHENEWVAPSWMLESPEYSKTIKNLEGARQNKFASGGFTSPDFDTINNSISSDNAMRMLRQDNMIMLDRIEQLSNRPIYTIATDVANVNNKVNNRIKTNTIGG